MNCAAIELNEKEEGKSNLERARLTPVISICVWVKVMLVKIQTHSRRLKKLALQLVAAHDCRVRVKNLVWRFQFQNVSNDLLIVSIMEEVKANSSKAKDEEKASFISLGLCRFLVYVIVGSLLFPSLFWQER